MSTTRFYLTFVCREFCSAVCRSISGGTGRLRAFTKSAANRPGRFQTAALGTCCFRFFAQFEFAVRFSLFSRRWVTVVVYQMAKKPRRIMRKTRFVCVLVTTFSRHLSFTDDLRDSANFAVLRSVLGDLPGDKTFYFAWLIVAVIANLFNFASPSVEFMMICERDAFVSRRNR